MLRIRSLFCLSCKLNAQFRAVINGQLISVPAGFYDPWIINCISEDEPVQIKEVVELI